MKTILTLLTVSLNLFAATGKDEKIKGMLKSITTKAINCSSKDIEIVKYTPLSSSKFLTFTWMARCGKKNFSCSTTENGPICSNLKQ